MVNYSYIPEVSRPEYRSQHLLTLFPHRSVYQANEANRCPLDAPGCWNKLELPASLQLHSAVVLHQNMH